MLELAVDVTTIWQTGITRLVERSRLAFKAGHASTNRLVRSIKVTSSMWLVSMFRVNGCNRLADNIGTDLVGVVVGGESVRVLASFFSGGRMGSVGRVAGTSSVSDGIGLGSVSL